MYILHHFFTFTIHNPSNPSSSSTCVVTTTSTTPSPLYAPKSIQAFISTHSIPPTDRFRPAAADFVAAVSRSVHTHPALQDTHLAKSDYSPAGAVVQAVEAEERSPVAHSGPTGFVAAAVAAAVPTAGAAGAVLEAGRKIVGVRGVKRGCIGVGLGCRIGLFGADGRIVVAGMILGEAEADRMSVVDCRRRTVAVT